MKRLPVFLPLITYLLLGCAKEQPKPPGQPAVSVATEVVLAREVPEVLQAVGTVESRNEAVLSAKIMGAIREFRVDEGSRVRKGDVLLTIDASDVKARKQEAGQARAEGLAALKEAEAAMKEAKAALENSGINLERMQNLYKEKAVTKKELDDMTTQNRMADARVEQVEAKRKQVQARIAQAEAVIAQTDVMLGYSVIRSPMGGVVSAKMANTGEMASPGRPLVKVLDAADLRLLAVVKEDETARVKKGGRVKVTVDALPGLELDGRISEVLPAADPATRSFSVKVDLPGGKGLRPGMFGRAHLPLGVRRAVLLPKGSLVDREGMQGVYVVTPEHDIRFQAVRPGGEVGGAREALSGLGGGEKVVVGDLGRVREGMKAASN